MVVTRKVQKTGGATYTVSLPKKWIDGQIEEGQNLYMERIGSDIRISFDQTEKKDEMAIIEASKDLEVTQRRMVAAYLNGFNEIKVRKIEVEKEKVLRFIRNNLRGMEITKIDKDSATLKNIFKSSEFPLKNGLRRMNSTILTMMEDLIDDPEKVKEMDDILDRYYLLLLRQLLQIMKNPELKNEMNLESDLQIIDYRLVAKYLERIGDHLVAMANEESADENAVRTFIEIYERIGLSIFTSDLSEIEHQIRRLEDIKSRQNMHVERIRRLMLDICETAVNFSIVESDVMHSGKSSKIMDSR